MAASFFGKFGQGFRKAPGQNNNGSGGNSGTNSPTSYQSPSSATAPSLPPFPVSPALSAVQMDDSPDQGQTPPGNRRPFFFREEYSNLIVKGNFMTLAAKPVHVEEGEWLAHQVVEQYRLLDIMLGTIKVVDDKTGQPICNQQTCPTMSASGHTYTWLDQAKRPIKIPAAQYIHLVQRWINGKISDPSLFPTDVEFRGSNSSKNASSAEAIPAGPTSVNASLGSLSGRSDWLGKASGFPESFESDLKSIYRQMMRCYAHIYHGHYLNPFWHTNTYKELNTCFLHFVNVGRTFGLLLEKELEPMMGLVEIWAGKGLLAQSTVPAPIGTAKPESHTPTGSREIQAEA